MRLIIILRFKRYIISLYKRYYCRRLYEHPLYNHKTLQNESLNIVTKEGKHAESASDKIRRIKANLLTCEKLIQNLP